jgi:beta-lactam-binding protein with PASTA domain
MNKLIASLAVGFFSVAAFAATTAATPATPAAPAVPAVASKADAKADAKTSKDKAPVAKKAEAAK